MLDSLIHWPAAGRYIVAVSGGADSMALLHLLAAQAQARGYQLVVAHFDHGLRADSAADSQFVEAAAAAAGLPFVVHQAQLGAASEAAARAARHAWLQQQRRQHRAIAVITAHHQDDLIETSLLNLARGSGRRGLAPMQSSTTILRPLLGVSRTQLRRYVASSGVTWREDSTNAEISNPRNLLRRHILAAASPEWWAAYLEMIDILATLNTKIDQSISGLLDSSPLPSHAKTSSYKFIRSDLTSAPDAVMAELIVAASLRLCPGVELNQRLIADTVRYVRTARGNTHHPLRAGLQVSIRTPHIVIHLGPLPKPSSPDIVNFPHPQE